MADLTWVGDRGILVASDSGESLSPQPHRWNGGHGVQVGLGLIFNAPPSVLAGA